MQVEAVGILSCSVPAFWMQKGGSRSWDEKWWSGEEPQRLKDQDLEAKEGWAGATCDKFE